MLIYVDKIRLRYLVYKDMVPVWSVEYHWEYSRIRLEYHILVCHLGVYYYGFGVSDISMRLRCKDRLSTDRIRLKCKFGI